LPVTPSDAQVLQYSLWSQRQQEFQARQRYYDEVLARLKETQSSKQRDIEQLQAQQLLMNEIEEMRRKLAQAEVGSRLNLLMAQRESNNLARSLATIKSELDQIGHQLESTEAERDIFFKQWNNQITIDQVRLGDERNGLLEQLTKARRRLSLVELKTPVDAVVLEIGTRSVGSIIQSGAMLIRLVPLNSPLEVEGYIAAKDIGNVQIGDPVYLKLDAYPFIEHGMMEGVVKVISEDAFTDPRAPAAGASYKTRIAIVKQSLRGLPEYFRLVPGTPLTAEIKVGTRSVLAYFLRPITRGLEEGLREP
jgi:hemolysin D